MRREKIDEILAKIDEAVGAPESETEEDRDQRRQMIERDALARRIRRGS